MAISTTSLAFYLWRVVGEERMSKKKSIHKPNILPEVHVDFLGTLSSEYPVAKINPYDYTLFIKGEIPEHILDGIKAHYEDPKKPVPELLKVLIDWEKSEALPPIEITRLMSKFNEKFPGLLRELVNRVRENDRQDGKGGWWRRYFSEIVIGIILIVVGILIDALFKYLGMVF